MTTEHQQPAKALLSSLKNSEADQVELFLKEEWQTYVKNLDAIMLKACKLTDLQQELKIQLYVPCLQKYVARRDNKEPCKAGEFSSPVNLKRPMTPTSPASSSLSQRHCGDHTELHDLKGSLAITHTVLAKVLVSLATATTINTRGEQVARYSFVVGSNSATIEVSLLGREATTVANLMSPFVGKGVRLSKVEWDGPRQMLRHAVETVVIAFPAEHELQHVAFMYAALETLPSLTGWSRVSIEGYVHTSSETTPSPRHRNKRIREITVSDFQCQGVKVRLISSDKDATHFLDKQSDMHVQLNYAKVNLTSVSVFADLDDLTSIVQSGKDSVLRPEPSFVKEIDWSRR